MEKGKKFYIIQSYMKIGARIDIACERGEDISPLLQERMDRAQLQYDEIMKDCPMEFRGYTQEKYEWDQKHIQDYYTMWEREDIFLTKKSLKRCKQWEKKHSLEHFQVLDDKKKHIHQIQRMEQREEQLSLKERHDARHT